MAIIIMIRLITAFVLTIVVAYVWRKAEQSKHKEVVVP